MAVIQPYFRPYTDQRSSPFAAAWMSFVGTRSEMNMMAIQQQMKLMDPSLVNEQILRAQKNIVELQKLKFELQQKSNSERSRWLSKSGSSGDDEAALKTILQYEEQLAKESSPTTWEHKEAATITEAIDAFDKAWGSLKLGAELSTIVNAGGDPGDMFVKIMDLVGEKTDIAVNANNTGIFSALVSDKLHTTEGLKPHQNRKAQKLEAVLKQQIGQAGTVGTDARSALEKKAAAVKDVKAKTVDQELQEIAAGFSELGATLAEDGTVSMDLEAVGKLSPEDQKEYEALEARLQRAKQYMALSALQKEGGQTGASGPMPPAYDPAELEQLIKDEEKSLRALRQRQSRMIEQGPGAIFSPFDRSLVKETPFTYSPRGFSNVERGRVYKTAQGTPVGITKAGKPFYYDAEGNEHQPQAGSQEYADVVEMLRSLP